MMDTYVRRIMASGRKPTRDDLIAAIHEVIATLQQPENAKARQNFISHIPIAMLECIASGGGESFRYHVRPHVNEK